MYDSGPVRMAHRASVEAAWTIETVDLGGSPDIALGPDDNVHVVYGLSDGTTSTLRYTERANDGTYPSEQVISTPWSSLSLANPSITIDEQDNVHIVFTDKHNNHWTQRYAHRDTTNTWHYAWLDACNHHPADITTDTQNNPHIACHAPGTGLAHYTTTPTTPWTMEPITTGQTLIPPRGPGGTGYEPSITTDTQNNLHVSFRTGFNPTLPDDPTRPAHLYYATKPTHTTDWHIEPVDTRGTGVGMESAINVNPTGQPGISYLIAWRTNSATCAPHANGCDDLGYAEPLPATLHHAVEQPPAP